MRKVTVLSLIALMVVASAFPVAAQEDDVSLEPCTEEEWAVLSETGTMLGEAGVALDEISTDMTDAVYGEVLSAADQLSSQYWTEIYPTLPNCAESQLISFIFGSLADDAAVAAGLSNIAGWATVNELADTTDYFVTAATTRIKSSQEETASLMEVDIAEWLGEDLVECTDEEYVVYIETLNALSESFAEVQAQLSADITEDAFTLAPLVVLSNDVAEGYWTDIYPLLPYCAESQYAGYLAGTILDEGNLITILYVNAALEGENGNTELAETLVASADARLEANLELAAELESYLALE